MPEQAGRPEVEAAREAVVAEFTRLCADPDDEAVAGRADAALNALDVAFARRGVKDAAQLPAT